MLISDKLAEVPDFAGWGGEEGKGGKAPGKGGPEKGKGSCEGMGGWKQKSTILTLTKPQQAAYHNG